MTHGALQKSDSLEVPAVPRVAFFTDCFHEVNGVALTSRELDSFARRHKFPFLSAHAGPETMVKSQGGHTTVELRRSLASVPLDAGMHFDLLGWRHLPFVERELRRFKPDLIHITGPGDCGLLGVMMAWRMRVPMVASWHTNLHEFGARRLEFVMPKRLARVSEGWMLKLLQFFYRAGRVLLAPNPELVDMLRSATGRPTFLMRRGIDTALFTPGRRKRGDEVFTVGYVGRLSPEKNVRVLAEIEQGLEATGFHRFRILIVGQGNERPWLAANVKRAEFTGVLRGPALAEAYANMDTFVFPSETDTFGNVVLEALASGVPTIVTGNGGPKFLIADGVTGFVAGNAAGFAESVAALMRDPQRRQAMSAAAREYALGISWDAVFEKVYHAYRASIIKPDAARTRG